VSALVVDTSSWIAYFAGGGSELIDEALSAGSVRLPPIVAAELLSGKLSAGDQSELESLLRDLTPCPADLDHWFRVGALRARLQAKGVSVSTPDAHVAQCALDASAVLLSEDKVFERIAAHTALRLVAG
jgi:predicted nucleic acid-binding protein